MYPKPTKVNAVADPRLLRAAHCGFGFDWARSGYLHSSASGSIRSSHVQNTAGPTANHSMSQPLRSVMRISGAHHNVTSEAFGFAGTARRRLVRRVCASWLARLAASNFGIKTTAGVGCLRIGAAAASYSRSMVIFAKRTAPTIRGTRVRLAGFTRVAGLLSDPAGYRGDTGKVDNPEGHSVAFGDGQRHRPWPNATLAKKTRSAAREGCRGRETRLLGGSLSGWCGCALAIPAGPGITGGADQRYPGSRFSGIRAHP
jgi:hypothetical protein